MTNEFNDTMKNAPDVNAAFQKSASFGDDAFGTIIQEYADSLTNDPLAAYALKTTGFGR